jgi:hypothetical protein
MKIIEAVKMPQPRHAKILPQLQAESVCRRHHEPTPAPPAVELAAFAADGSQVGTAKSQPGDRVPQQLTINGHGMVQLPFGTGVIEGTLIQLCAPEDVGPPRTLGLC